MESKVDERYSPRVPGGFLVKLFPDTNVNVLNISETGIQFDCEGPVLPEDIVLLMDLNSFKSKQQKAKIQAKVVWQKKLVKSSQFGAQFSLLDKNHFSEIRDFIFDHFAKKASSSIKDNKNLKCKVEDFFNKDVRYYHEQLSILVQDLSDHREGDFAIEKKVTELINTLLLKGEALEKLIDNESCVKKIKQVFREVVGCWAYKSPILNMAYSKPRGYPGDFELFEIIYNNKPLAEKGSVGYYSDKYFLNNDYAKAARCRKNRMKNILQDLIENTDLNTVKLLNVACGPSREIRELFSTPLLVSEVSSKKIIFTGLDYDKDALKFSKSALENFPSNFEARFLHESVLDIFRNDKYYEVIGRQDIIYILGLTEYLPDRIFKRLIKFLFELLNSKGKLVITYKDKDITFPSLPPEWLCDWAFIKRSKDDLIDAAKELGEGKYSLKIDREGTGTIFFLSLTKI